MGTLNVSLFRKSLAIASLSVPVWTLIGCTIGSFPDATLNPSYNSLGTIQGSVYGGHAPLVGAHVYVLQPGITGYGSQATSLLSASYTGTTYPTHANASDPSIPTTGTGTPWYYETTDATGAFNITGDYSCVVGLPVYLYAYGGSPTFPSANNKFNISSASNSVTIAADATSGYDYTFTVNAAAGNGGSGAPENFYIGEPVTFAGLGAVGTLSALNGNNYTVTAVNLTTTTFTVNVATSPSGTGTFTPGTTATATVTPAFNPGVVNLAVLGVCPSSGNFSTSSTIFNGNTVSPLQYVYMNEVATVAADYAFQGFALPTNNDAVHIGTSTTNSTTVTVSGSTYTAYLGIDNAALNAGQLYDIQGGELSTSYAGEGHIARAVTPAGNGYIPQTTLDTLGNILAACVDSNNTSTVDASAGESAQCKTLFETATSNGIPNGNTGAGTIPVDTATAGLNIARYPAGNPTYSTTFMSSLYSLPTANVPFTPHVTGTTAPNDFLVSINYPATSGTNGTTVANPFLDGPALGPEGITIDNFGNVWGATYVSGGSGYVFELSPQGVIDYSFLNPRYPYGYVSVDPSNHIYLGDALAGQFPVTTVTGGSTLNGSCAACTISNVGTATYWGVYGLINNSAGNLIWPGSTVGAGSANNLYLYTPGTGVADVNTTPFSNGTATSGSHLAVDGAGYFWISMENSGDDVGRFTSAGTNGSAGTFSIAGITQTGGGGDQPEVPAIDANNTGWIPMQTSNRLMKLVPNNTTSPYYTQTFYTSGTGTGTTGAAFSEPFGAHVDGGGNLWVVNRGNNTLVSIDTTTAKAISPTTNYQPTGFNTPLNLDIDQSGDIWVTNLSGTNGVVTEVVGAAYPSAIIAKQAPGVKP